METIDEIETLSVEMGCKYYSQRNALHQNDLNF